MKQIRHSNKGFTLVELSIVLVIIGLIIGGVLSGRQIMKNTQVTNAVNSIQAYQAQFQTYVQNYGAMPGDDAGATSRFKNLSTDINGIIANGDGSGTLDGTFDASISSGQNPAPSVETQFLWIDLRAAGLVKNQTSGIQPANPFGGIYGFQHGAFDITTNVLCLNNVPSDAAGAIDSRLDDGSSNTGSIQAIADVSATASKAASGATADASYVAGQTYSLCVGM